MKHLINRSACGLALLLAACGSDPVAQRSGAVDDTSANSNNASEPAGTEPPATCAPAGDYD